MNYNHLFYFYEVVRANGVAEAARRLKITQPALSAQIKTFEKDCGGALLEKARGEARLTARGKLVFRFALGMFERTEILERHLTENVHVEELDVLNLGVSDDIERSFVIEVIKTFYAGYDSKHRPRVRLASSPPSEIIVELRRGTFDVVVTDRPNYSEDFSSLVEVPMPVGIVFKSFSRHFTQADLTSVRQGKTSDAASAIAKLVRSGCAFPTRPMKLREEVDLYLEKTRVTVTPLIESNIISLLKRAAVDDIVSTILPFPYAARECHDGQLHFAAPPEGLWQHSLQLLTRAQTAHAPVLERLSRAFNESVRLHPA